MHTTQEEQTRFTAQQTEELELARQETQQAVAKAQQAKNALQKLEDERNAIVSGEALQSALVASGIRFHDPKLLTALLGEFEVQVSGGIVTAVVDGNRTTQLERVYESIAAKHPTLTDRRTTRSIHWAAPTPQQKPLSQMTRSEKVDFIEKQGLPAFTKLAVRKRRT